jgi:hypothetical protein
VGDKAIGWNEIKCAGNLFTGVFASHGEHNSDRLGLLGWGSPSVGNNEGEGKDSALGLVDALDECVDADLKELKGKGLQYVIVRFDLGTKTVTEAKPFIAPHVPGVNPANYNQCAQLAGARAATVSIPEMTEIVSASGLSGHASCGTGACCIDIK